MSGERLLAIVLFVGSVAPAPRMSPTVADRAAPPADRAAALAGLGS